MSGFANAVVGFGKDVIQTGMGFDRQMSAVQAVLGTTEGTMDNMERLRTFALKQARDSIYTAEQTGQAYYYMGMAGWKTEQMLAGLPGIMALAAASGEDLGRVSDIVTDSITAFGLTADDVGGYVDVLAATVTNSNTDVQQLGNAFKYAGSVAGGLGADVDDVALSLGLMANAGVKSSQAGTSMRSMFTRLANDTNDARSTMEKLGTTIFDSEGNMRDWGDIITEARAGWKGLTQEQQAQYATTIAGQRGMTGFMAIMNATDEEFIKLERSIAEANGTAQEMADVKLDNLWGDTVRFNSALDILKVAIYDDVKGPMRELVQYGTGALNRITTVINEQGLAGGIRQLGFEITGFSKKFAPVLESLGQALAPLVTSLIENVAPALGESAITLGQSLGRGLIQGLRESFGEDSLVSKLIGGPGSLLGNLFLPEENVAGPDMTISPDISVEDVQAKLSEALNSGAQEVVIDGKSFTIEGAEGLINDLLYGSGGGTVDVSGVGTEAGSEIATEIGTEVSSVDSSGLATALGNAGPVAGSAISSAIQSAISAVTYSINVAANVTGLPTSGGGTVKPDKRSKSMYGGTILRGATLFGINDKGQPMVGGEVGPEAIVGVNSLHSMIQSSVSNAMMAMADRLEGAFAAQSTPDLQVVLDTGALVGGITNKMNRALGATAARRSTGRV